MTPFGNMRFRLFDGHTPGQTVAFVEADGLTNVFAGDVIPLFSHITPHFISAYDFHPAQSYDAKWQLLEEVAALHGRLVFYHDVQKPCGYIRKTRSSFVGTVGELTS